MLKTPGELEFLRNTRICAIFPARQQLLEISPSQIQSYWISLNKIGEYIQTHDSRSKTYIDERVSDNENTIMLHKKIKSVQFNSMKI